MTANHEPEVLGQTVAGVVFTSFPPTAEHSCMIRTKVQLRATSEHYIVPEQEFEPEVDDMALIRVDMIEGRSPDEIKPLLDATHRALVAVFEFPERDRYQIVHEHPPPHFIVEDTGLGITRTRQCVVIQITTRPREREAKESFYKALCGELEATCGIPPSDVVVSTVTRSDEDWSFGNGRAQFLTGELASEGRVA